MPVLTATGAGVRHRRRWLFRDLDVTAEPGELLAVVGLPGSGRTTVLLALARRLRLSTGKIQLSGTAALGYVPDVEQPEPVFTVAEHVRERLALLGRPARKAAAVIADGLYGLDPALKGWQLTPYQKQLLGLALARLAEPAVIALDGLDVGLDATEQAQLWQILGELAGTGLTVVVTARDVDPERVTTVIRLGDRAPALPTEKPAAAGAGVEIAATVGGESAPAEPTTQDTTSEPSSPDQDRESAAPDTNREAAATAADRRAYAPDLEGIAVAPNADREPATPLDAGRESIASDADHAAAELGTNRDAVVVGGNRQAAAVDADRDAVVVDRDRQAAAVDVDRDTVAVDVNRQAAVVDVDPGGGLAGPDLGRVSADAGAGEK